MKKFKSKVKLLARISVSIISLTCLTYVFGFACSPAPFKSTQVELSSVAPGNSGFDSPLDKSGVLTAGVPILSQSYSSLVGALQVQTPSAQSRQEFDRQLGLLSETGKKDSVGIGFSLASISLSAQVCLDRVNAEINPGANPKVFFNSLTLNAAPAASVNEASLNEVINRLARSLWQRNETAAERKILIDAVNESMLEDTGNNAVETQEAALFLCTAMASSISGLEF